tara:strand:+ start:341 stop:700 length:360 start_codon:yes stop_codon:yes gene_type:complete
MSEMLSITKLEKQLLTDIALSDHSSDGYGFTMWVNCGYETMSMSQARGVISSLIQKEIIWFKSADPRNGDMYAHVCPRETFMTDTRKYVMAWDKGVSINSPFTNDGVYGFKYINLEVVE